MIPERLEELVIKHKKEGHLPFFVNCTTGSILTDGGGEGCYRPLWSGRYALVVQ
jgi:hypothetical protein